MNLLTCMPATAIEEFGESFNKYEVFTITDTGSSLSHYHGFPQSDNQRDFMKAVHQKLLFLARIYDDPKINKRLDWLLPIE